MLYLFDYRKSKDVVKITRLRKIQFNIKICIRKPMQYLKLVVRHNKILYIYRYFINSQS